VTDQSLEQPVEVVRWTVVPPPDEDDDFGLAARHTNSKPSWFERTTRTGQHALMSASEEIAAQADLVSEQMMIALEQRQDDRRRERARARVAEPEWEVADVQVKFAVKLTGEATVQVFAVGSEASAEITLNFSRRSQPPQP
jgi:hypothetical protein